MLSGGVGITAVVTTLNSYTHQQFLISTLFKCSSQPVDLSNLLKAIVLIIFVYIYKASCLLS
jgi:hypothetical protein